MKSMARNGLPSRRASGSNVFCNESSMSRSFFPRMAYAHYHGIIMTIPSKQNFADNTSAVRYTPAEGDSGMFGGNSNWRGPVWFPMNMLLINALERYSLVYGDDYKLEYPTLAAASSTPLSKLLRTLHDGW